MQHRDKRVYHVCPRHVLFIYLWCEGVRSLALECQSAVSRSKQLLASFEVLGLDLQFLFCVFNQYVRYVVIP